MCYNTVMEKFNKQIHDQILKELLEKNTFSIKFIRALFGREAEDEFNLDGCRLTNPEYWERNHIMNLLILEYFDV